MLDTITSANARDFLQRYGQSYGWYVDSSKRIPVFIQDLDGERLIFQGLDGTPYFAVLDKNVTFEFLPFKRRILRGADQRLYTVRRVPARQWTRGVSSKNTAIFELTAEGVVPKRVDRTTMRQVLSPVDIPVVGDTYLLSPCFAIVSNKLFMYEEQIGSVSLDSVTLFPTSIRLNGKYSLLVQDVLDAVKKTPLLEKVTVYAAKSS